MRRILLPILLLTTLAQAQTASIDDRRKSLNTLFAEYWDSALEHSPEFASEIGDTRFSGKLTDYSPSAQNSWIAREQDYLMKLAAIDASGLPAADAKAREDLLNQLTGDIEASGSHDWETPVNEDGGVFTQYANLPAEIPFSTAKDYDNWIARLRALSDAIDQNIANMGTGIDDHRVPPKTALTSALEQIKQIAAAKPEESPFAAPLAHFPAAIPAAEQQRIQQETLDAITKQVQPAYQRLVHFFEVSYLPAAGAENPASQPDSPAFTLQSRKIQILALRDKAKEALSPKFNLSAFHDIVSSYGILPPAVLEAHVNDWIASQPATPK